MNIKKVDHQWGIYHNGKPVTVRGQLYKAYTPQQASEDLKFLQDSKSFEMYEFETTVNYEPR